MIRVMHNFLHFAIYNEKIPWIYFRTRKAKPLQNAHILQHYIKIVNNGWSTFYYVILIKNPILIEKVSLESIASFYCFTQDTDTQAIGYKSKKSTIYICQKSDPHILSLFWALSNITWALKLCKLGQIISISQFAALKVEGVAIYYNMVGKG